MTPVGCFITTSERTYCSSEPSKETDTFALPGINFITFPSSEIFIIPSRIAISPLTSQESSRIEKYGNFLLTYFREGIGACAGKGRLEIGGETGAFTIVGFNGMPKIKIKPEGVKKFMLYKFPFTVKKREQLLVSLFFFQGHDQAN